LYIAAARVYGLPNRHLVVHHVLPRVAGPIIVQISMLAGGALLIDAGLSYLGFGAQPPDPTWGNMIADASAVIDRQPWLLLPPGVVLGLAILSFGLLGDAVRDATADRSGHPGERPVRAPAPMLDHHTGGSAALLSLRGMSIALPGTEGARTVVTGVDLDVHA